MSDCNCNPDGTCNECVKDEYRKGYAAAIEEAVKVAEKFASSEKSWEGRAIADDIRDLLPKGTK